MLLRLGARSFQEDERILTEKVHQVNDEVDTYHLEICQTFSLLEGRASNSAASNSPRMYEAARSDKLSKMVDQLLIYNSSKKSVTSNFGFTFDRKIRAMKTSKHNASKSLGTTTKIYVRLYAESKESLALDQDSDKEGLDAWSTIPMSPKQNNDGNSHNIFCSLSLP